MKKLAAPPAWRAIDFISDLHLGADHPRTFDAWRRFMAGTSADAVFILGDLFEVWVGDDARSGEFESACVDVLAQAARRLQVAFMHGNRDFLVGPDMLRASHMALLADPTLLDAWGRAVVLTHGDALCLADVDYQRFRAEVRGAAWQQSFLSRPLEQRQAIARGMRDASALAQRQRTSWADVDPAAAVALLREHRSVEMVHGHTHHPGDSEFAPGFVRHVLTDWELDAGPPRAQVLRLTRCHDAGLVARLARAACAQPARHTRRALAGHAAPLLVSRPAIAGRPRDAAQARDAVPGPEGIHRCRRLRRRRRDRRGHCGAGVPAGAAPGAGALQPVRRHRRARG